MARSQKPPDAALQVGFNFRNVSTSPLRVRIEEFRLMIEDRTCPDPDNAIELTVPRLSARAIRSGAFKKDVIKEHNIGTLSVQIIYGPADGEFLRRYHFKTKLQFAFQQTEGQVTAGAIHEDFISDKDEPI